MNDDELITLVREQRTKVPMTAPVEQIIRRGHAVRARRRIPGMAGALAVVTAAVLAVAALLPGGHQASPGPGAHLAAWTVVKRADGAIYVTVRQLRNPAGLQRRLRADGVPATVTFAGRRTPRSCRGYPTTIALIKRVFSVKGPPLVIHPAALPSGAGVQLNPGHYPPGAPISIGVGLVYTSPGCTGR